MILNISKTAEAHNVYTSQPSRKIKEKNCLWKNNINIE